MTEEEYFAPQPILLYECIGCGRLSEDAEFCSGRCEDRVRQPNDAPDYFHPYERDI